MFWNKDLRKARKAKKILDIMELPKTKKAEIAALLTTEILENDYEMQGYLSKGQVLSKFDKELLNRVRQMVLDEGLMSHKKIENKSGEQVGNVN